MARQLVQTAAVLCDWHAALPTPEKIEASAQRVASSGKELDFCGFCALVWDGIFPRLDEILQMLQPEVIEAVLRAAHSIKEPEARQPVQLAMHSEHGRNPPALEAATQKAKKQSASPAPSRGAKNGRWIDGEDQVRCPLPHRAGSPETYWVKVRDRGSHANASHHLLGPQVAYELPDPQTTGHMLSLPVKCFEHKVCAEAGGYGFRDESGLRFHITRSKKWEPSKDAAETVSASVG